MCKKNKSYKSLASKVNLEKLTYGIALGIVVLIFTTNSYFFKSIDETNRKIYDYNIEIREQTGVIDKNLEISNHNVKHLTKKIDNSFGTLNDNFNKVTNNFFELQNAITKKVNLDNRYVHLRDFPPIPQREPIILQNSITNAQLLESLKIPVIGDDDRITEENLRTRIHDGVLDISGKDGGFVFFKSTEASFYRVEGFFTLASISIEAKYPNV